MTEIGVRIDCGMVWCLQENGEVGDKEENDTPRASAL